MRILRHLAQRNSYFLFLIHSCRRLLRGQGPNWAELKNAGYDRQTRQVMQRVLRRNSNCIDGGAHQGLVLATICRLAPAGRHHAFEPLPHLYRELCANFPQVAVHDCALGDQRGSTTFTHVVNAPAYSGLRPRTYDGIDVELKDIPVTVERLDDVIGASDTIALIKLDLEGGEYHALAGGTALIRRCRPVILFEAGAGSTGHYGVSGDMLYTLITGDLGLQLSTQQRWLRGQPGFDRAGFLQAYEREFFFIAYP